MARGAFAVGGPPEALLKGLEVHFYGLGRDAFGDGLAKRVGRNHAAETGQAAQHDGISHDVAAEDRFGENWQQAFIEKISSGGIERVLL